MLHPINLQSVIDTSYFTCPFHPVEYSKDTNSPFMLNIFTVLLIFILIKKYHRELAGDEVLNIFLFCFLREHCRSQIFMKNSF
jgi:hypothetical protein